MVAVVVVVVVVAGIRRFGCHAFGFRIKVLAFQRKEYRRICLELEAAIGIPKSRRTVFRQNAFVSISWGRFLVLLVTSLARALIASVLLFAGILWLARTTSIQEPGLYSGIVVSFPFQYLNLERA